MSQITDLDKQKFLTVYIPDTRGVQPLRYGRGNLKIGLDGVYTYSRLPGDPQFAALGGQSHNTPNGTCPGATTECQAICYAARPVAEKGLVRQMWTNNSASEVVPPIPEDCKLLRIHISGDFTTVTYIYQWVDRLRERPDVRAWAYTRSWRVRTLLGPLETLRALPNMQLFASMDQSHTDEPPVGWRRAWIRGDERLSRRELKWVRPGLGVRYSLALDVTHDRVSSYRCPEQTGAKENCEACRYCFDGQRHDVTFYPH